MEKFIERLDSQSLLALKFALNKSTQSIMSGNFWIEMNYPFIEATTLSINLTRNEYLIISSDWSSTPKEMLDIYFLQARISNKPADIKTEDDPKLKNSLVHYPNFSSIHLLGGESKIKEIYIYEDCEVGDTEEVVYDSAIIFKRNDDLSFLIKNSESIMPLLYITTDRDEIQNIASTLKLRVHVK